METPTEPSADLGEVSRQYEIAYAIDISQHAFSPSQLKKYIYPKVHDLIRTRVWHRVLVVGKFARQPPYIVCTTSEKKNKPFNRFRPTARVVDETTIEIACFPGQYYIQHYALIIATYLAMEDREDTIVQYENMPHRLDALALDLCRSHLRLLGSVDTVVVGYVDRLPQCMDTNWEGEPASDEGLFAWHESLVSQRGVVYLGCMVSFWGDISVQLARALAEHGMRRMIYIGKAGTLRPLVTPNGCIATGDRSFIGERAVAWNNVFQNHIDDPLFIAEGRHTTAVSPLLDSRRWVAHEAERGARWVDCEVGLLGEECNNLRVSFGYLHIVSDNVSLHHEHGIWNDNDTSVQQMRSHLFGHIDMILRSVLGRDN